LAHYGKTGKAWVVPAKKIHGTDELTDTATCALVEIYMDEIVDGALRSKVLTFC